MSSFKVNCLLAVVLISSTAVAQPRTYSRSTQSYSSSDVPRHNYISGAFGFMAPGQNTVVGTVSGTQQPTSFTTSGLFAIGGDYDYMLNKDFSVGGNLRYYNCSSTISNVSGVSQSVQESLFAFGPSAKAYLPSGDFLPYVAAGFEFMAPNKTVANNSYSITSGIGLMLAMGVLYNISDTVAVGIETMRLTGLSSSINGNIIEDYMLKGRFALGN